METCFAYVGWIGTFEGKKGTGKERVFQSELIDELVSLGAVVIGKVIYPAIITDVIRTKQADTATVLTRDYHLVA
jgi:predicted HAD superfamily hydrolase